MSCELDTGNLGTSQLDLDWTRTVPPRRRLPGPCLVDWLSLSFYTRRTTDHTFTFWVLPGRYRGREDGVSRKTPFYVSTCNVVKDFVSSNRFVLSTKNNSWMRSIRGTTLTTISFRYNHSTTLNSRETSLLRIWPTSFSIPNLPVRSLMNIPKRVSHRNPETENWRNSLTTSISSEESTFTDFRLSMIKFQSSLSSPRALFLIIITRGRKYSTCDTRPVPKVYDCGE